MLAAAETSAGLATIDQVVARAGALYSLPAVAAEVLELTSHPKVDVRSLKECIERDPALTVKILRVVNSSLFGLPREVSDLNQALALLGTKPLKLLVLGFSLPENLFLDVAREQLDWYWNSTLVRAVAAREISEHLFSRPGDDAFLAGLLRDLGVLALLGQLGQPYAALLSEAIAAHEDLSRLEREALGFDHVQLTAGLLEHWNMPTVLVRAVAEPYDVRLWAHNRAEHAPLVRALHLAELFAQLVGQRRLSVLPDLLEAGEAYCGLDKPKLNELVGALEVKVQQLAAVLSLNGSPKRAYSQILIEAHAQMSAVAETAAAPLSHAIAAGAASALEVGGEQERHALALARQLRASFENFFNRRPDVEKAKKQAEWDAPLPSYDGERDQLAIRLTLAVGQCRALRRPLSVVLLGVEGVQPLDREQALTVERLLEAACTSADVSSSHVERPAQGRRVLLLADRDRRAAVTTARSAVEHLRQSIAPLHLLGRLPVCAAAAGVASVSTPAKNFRSPCLLETAQRCLSAALTTGGVKSLEVS